MARLPRYFAKGVPQHVILRGNNREPIFANDEDCQFFKEAFLMPPGVTSSSFTPKLYAFPGRQRGQQ